MDEKLMLNLLLITIFLTLMLVINLILTRVHKVALGSHIFSNHWNCLFCVFLGIPLLPDLRWVFSILPLSIHGFPSKSFWIVDFYFLFHKAEWFQSKSPRLLAIWLALLSNCYFFWLTFGSCQTNHHEYISQH